MKLDSYVEKAKCLRAYQRMIGKWNWRATSVCSRITQVRQQILTSALLEKQPAGFCPGELKMADQHPTCCWDTFVLVRGKVVKCLSRQDFHWSWAPSHASAETEKTSALRRSGDSSLVKLLWRPKTRQGEYLKIKHTYIFWPIPHSNASNQPCIEFRIPQFLKNLSKGSADLLTVVCADYWAFFSRYKYLQISPDSCGHIPSKHRHLNLQSLIVSWQAPSQKNCRSACETLMVWRLLIWNQDSKLSQFEVTGSAEPLNLQNRLNLWCRTKTGTIMPILILLFYPRPCVQSAQKMTLNFRWDGKFCANQCNYNGQNNTKN